MSVGTINLTNGSATVAGVSTKFTADLIPNDYIYTTIGGVPYTLNVLSIQSDTSLTLNLTYDGPTVTGQAWSAVPKELLSIIPSQSARDTAKALRSFLYDKVNWTQVYSAAGTITVHLLDGSTFTGPSWKYLAESLAGINTSIDNKAAKGANEDITSLSGLTTALSVAQGGTGQKTIAAALTSFGFKQTGSDRFFIPLASSAIMVICKSVVVTLDSNGDAVVSYPQAFNSFWCPILFCGDVNTLIGSLATGTFNNNGFTFRARTSTGGTPAGSTIRVNYIAIGVIN